MMFIYAFYKENRILAHYYIAVKQVVIIPVIRHNYDHRIIIYVTVFKLIQIRAGDRQAGSKAAVISRIFNFINILII